MRDRVGTDPNLADLTTEVVDERYGDLDVRSTVGMLEAMNEAEAEVPRAVRMVLPQIGELVDGVAARLRGGGRLIYVGAGTSGRLGIVDAAECPPTFHTPPEVIQALIAGGREAVFSAVESAEDSVTAGASDLAALEITARDAVVGIAASGRTPYVLGAVRTARESGALTGAIACNTGSELGVAVDHAVEVEVGPEVLAGSTRLKAGSATKQVLNMISTAVMVRNGKTYGNLMVDVAITNAKLRDRGERLIMRITGCEHGRAAQALRDSGDRVKVAAVMITHGLDRDAAEGVLRMHDGRTAPALETTDLSSPHAPRTENHDGRSP